MCYHPGGRPALTERTDTMSITASEEAAAILIRTLEALARQCGKTLSRKTRDDLARACELLAAGDSYDELLDDLLSAPPVRSDRVTVNFEREGNDRIPDEGFQKWRGQQRWSEEDDVRR